MKSTLRITTPHIATINQMSNCLKCHTNAKSGNVLGGKSMIFDLSDAKEKSVMTILKIIAITILFIFTFLYITNRFLTPYITVLSYIKDSLKRADRGDYIARIDASSSNEVYEVAKWLNALLEKLENTVGVIKANISLFIADRKKVFTDSLEKFQSVIKDIAMIYKFKKTKEQDKICQRLARLFKEQLHIVNLPLYEGDIKNNKRVLIYDDTLDKFCDIANGNLSIRCRAHITNSFVAAIVDIVFLKKVNDNYGHDMGDIVSRSLSEIFKKTISDKDIIFRFRREEFLIFISDIKNAENLLLNIKDTFENRVFEADSKSFNKTLSVGLYFYMQDSSQVWQVMKNADIALYEAKNSGRNRVVLFQNIKS